MHGQGNLSPQLATLLDQIDNVKRSQGGWSARCPAHEDHNNSLSIAEGDDGRVLLKCFAGCKTADIVTALRMSMTDLFPSDGSTHHRVREIVARYDYRDATGKLLFQVIRYRPKAFKQRRPDGSGGWIWNLTGVQRVLYRLPELSGADRETPVFITEGEKDADHLASLSVVATTNPGGAGRWRPEFNEPLRRRNIVILPDEDEAGRRHTETVAGSLHGVAASVKITHLPHLLPKQDVSDWFNADGSVETLMRLVSETPLWKPERQDDTQAHEASSGQRSQADRLVHWVLSEGVVMFRDPAGQIWGRLPIENHWETWSCQSKNFRRWLAWLYWRTEQKALSPQAISTAMTVLEAKGRFEGPVHCLFNRVARHDQAIWYDLADDSWQAIRITPEGWEVISDPPILFNRHAHQQPQVWQQPGGNLADLLSFVNLADSDHWLLLQVHVVSCLVPDIPHPIPVAHGPQGAAKTTLFRLLRQLIDPSVTETLTLPHDGKELVQQLSHHWAPFYDNITTLSDWLSDVLCRAVTGEGFSKRELYSDDEDVIYSFRRCVGLNGINVAAQKPDLLDRCLLFGLEPISSDRRLSEEELWSSFEQRRPALFGAMLDTLSRAMKLFPQIHLPALPRMADFSRWGCAISQALGYAPEQFLTAYHANLRTRNDEAIASSLVASLLTVFMDGRESWEGRASELLMKLERLAPEHHVDTRSRAWPKAPSVLTRRLNEVSPNLIAVGVTVEISRDGQHRHITLRRVPENAVTAVTSVTTAQGGLLPGDGICGKAETPSPMPSPENARGIGPRDACDAGDGVPTHHSLHPDDPRNEG